LMGLLASQVDEPSKEWAAKWSIEMGATLAHHVRRTRRA